MFVSLQCGLSGEVVWSEQLNAKKMMHSVQSRPIICLSLWFYTHSLYCRKHRIGIGSTSLNFTQYRIGKSTGASKQWTNAHDCIHSNIQQSGLREGGRVGGAPGGTAGPSMAPPTTCQPETARAPRPSAPHAHPRAPPFTHSRLLWAALVVSVRSLQACTSLHWSSSSARPCRHSFKAHPSHLMTV